MNDEDWIRGSRLSEIALPQFGSPEAMKDWLIFRLGKGRISARASTTIIRQVGAEPVVRLNDWEIPPHAWTFISLAHDARRIEFSDDLERMSGRFPPQVQNLDYGLRPFVCEGLEYLKRDLVTILGPLPVRTRPVTPRAGAGGVKPDKVRWTQFAAAFAVIAARDDINPNDDPGEIFKKIDDLLAWKGLQGFDKSNVIGAIELAREWTCTDNTGSG